MPNQQCQSAEGTISRIIKQIHSRSDDYFIQICFTGSLICSHPGLGQVLQHSTCWFVGKQFYRASGHMHFLSVNQQHQGNEGKLQLCKNFFFQTERKYQLVESREMQQCQQTFLVIEEKSRESQNSVKLSNGRSRRRSS